ncbi:hypothetical protein OsI_28835 [Oryza sativa Indica Group]|nr:hypothetical protein OsI_28835 [Oryza sativa Indica Group]
MDRRLYVPSPVKLEGRPHSSPSGNANDRAHSILHIASAGGAVVDGGAISSHAAGTANGTDERSSSRERDAGKSCRGHAGGHSMFVQPARLLLLHYWGRDELCPIRIGTNKRGR